MEPAVLSGHFARERIDGRVDRAFKVQVRAHRPAGHTDIADDLPAFDKLASRDQILSRPPESKLSGIWRISVCQRGRSEESAESQKLAFDYA